LNRDELIKRLKAIAFIKMEDVANFDGKNLTYKPISEWSEDAKLALMSSIEYRPNGTIAKIPMPDKVGALKELCTIAGLTQGLDTALGTVRQYGADLKHDGERWILNNLESPV
jgi:hypothetical protein